ncbi:MAG: class I SAM-dependent methyltransferase, partial [Thermoplasmata archaeon]|nr:class I SAM-dependent methyltransferase [Thermoplasmata archaeon]
FILLGWCPPTMVEKGDRMGLLGKDRRVHPVAITGNMENVPGVGVVDTSRLLALEPGETVSVNEREYTLVYPTLLDLMNSIERGAQTTTPKDAAIISLLSGARAGDLIVEGGAGSGRLTIALCHLVHPSGRVVTYEKREDFLRAAGKNIARAGYSQVSTIKHADITLGIEERGAAAVVLDIPEPWLVVEHAREALRPGGTWVSFTPTMGQMAKTVETLRDAGFFGVKAREVLEREMVVKENVVRPSFDMLGHTGYIVDARRGGRWR